MRKLQVTVVMIGLMCGTLAMGTEAGDRTTPSTDPPLLEAHEQLREAVEAIRAHRLKNGVEDVYFADLDGFRAEISRPRLGLVLGHTSDEGRGGAEVLAVTPGSSAEEVGLQAGDLIIRAGGVNLEEHGPHAVTRLIEMSRQLDEGERLTLEYLRDGKLFSADVEARVLDVPAALPKMRWTPGKFLDSGSGVGAKWFHFPGKWLDLELAPMNEELGEYFGTNEGVLVIRGPGDESLGVRGGDVILEIGGRMVKSPEHAMRILRSYDADEELLITIVRHQSTETLQATVPELEPQRFELHDHFFDPQDE